MSERDRDLVSRLHQVCMASCPFFSRSAADCRAAGAFNSVFYARNSWLHRSGHVSSHSSTYMSPRHAQRRYRDFEHFESCFNFSSRESLNFSVSSAAGDVCMVFFMNEEKTATATVRNVFEKIKAVERVKCAVFVIRKMMVPQARKALTEGMRECRNPITVDVFTESELVVNVMKHELVPEHKILSPADKRELLRKYHVTEAQLPRILVTGAATPPSLRISLFD